MTNIVTDPSPRARRFASALLRVLVIALSGLLWPLVAAAQDGSSYWYEAGAVNEGLERLEGLDRSTPRQTMRGFVDAAGAGDYDRAAHYLNLAHFAVEEQPVRGPDLARKMASVLVRQVWLDWAGLPARPDAMIETMGGSNDRAGEPRRNLHLETLSHDGAAYDLRIARYKPDAGEAVWLFTPQTVDNLPALYEAFGPRGYEDLIPEGLKHKVGGLWLWELIALPLLALMVTGLGWAAHQGVCRMSSHASRIWVKNAARRSAMPVALFVMAGIGQAILTWVISFSGPVNAIVRPAFTIVMVWAVGMTALRILDAALHRITLRFVGEIDDKRGFDERAFYTSIYALRRLIVLVMVVLAAIIVLARLNLFDSIGMTLLASAGVLTVIFGIAGQAVLGNIIASLQIAFAKPVRIGDAVLFEGEWAYVEAIFYTFLRLRTWDKRRIVVPVTYFISKPFENWSVTEARMMRVIDLWLDPRADVEMLRRHFQTLLEDDPDVEDTENSFVYATDHTSEGYKVSFYAMMPDPSTGWTAQSRLREKLLAYVRDRHPEWLTRQRVLDVGSEEDEEGGPGTHGSRSTARAGGVG